MVKGLKLGLVLCLVTATCVSAAVGDNFIFRLEPASGPELSRTVVAEWDVDGIQGWSFGVCHDPAEASIGACSGEAQPANPCIGGCPEITCPDDMQTPGPADQAASFHSLNIFDNGVTQGIVLDFLQSWDLSVGASPFEILTITYTLSGESATLDFCDTLGSPAVDNVVVLGGSSITPGTLVGAVIGEDPTPCGDSILNLGAAAVDASSAMVPVLLTTGEEHDVSGFQLGLGIDTADATVADIVPGSVFDDPFGAPDFFGVTAVEGGATLGCLIDLEPEGQVFRTLPACTENQEVAVAMVNCAGSGTVSVTLGFSEELGTPVVPVWIDVDATSIKPTIGSDITFNLICEELVEFSRGDTNQDNVLNVSDAVAIAKALFGLGSKLPLIQACEDSADVDDDGALDVGDAVYLLDYLFLSGSMIPAPMGTCGIDETADDLGCEAFACP